MHDTGLHMFASCPVCGAVPIAMCHVDRTDKTQMKRVRQAAGYGYQIEYVGDDRFAEFRDRIGKCTCGKPADKSKQLEIPEVGDDQ